MRYLSVPFFVFFVIFVVHFFVDSVGPEGHASRAINRPVLSRRRRPKLGMSASSCALKTGPSTQTRRPSHSHWPQTPMPHFM